MMYLYVIILFPLDNPEFELHVVAVCSELNDTVVEAQLRIRQAPPALPVNYAIEHYMQSSNRLLILVLV